jgi:hypothetical protein
MFLDNSYLALGSSNNTNETKDYGIIFDWMKMLYSVPWYYSYDDNMPPDTIHYYKIVAENPNTSFFSQLIPMAVYKSSNHPTSKNDTTCKVYAHGVKISDSNTAELTGQGQILAVFTQAK